MNKGTRRPSKAGWLQSVVKSSCLFAHPDVPPLLKSRRGNASDFGVRTTRTKKRTPGDIVCAQPSPLSGLVFFQGAVTQKYPFTVQPSVLLGNDEPCQLLADLPGWTAAAPVGCPARCPRCPWQWHLRAPLRGRGVVRIFPCFGVINIPGFRS